MDEAKNLQKSPVGNVAVEAGRRSEQGGPVTDPGLLKKNVGLPRRSEQNVIAATSGLPTKATEVKRPYASLDLPTGVAEVKRIFAQGNSVTPRKPNLPAWVVKPRGGLCKPVAELSDEELYQKCRECGQNAKDWSRKFAALLPEVVKRGLHRRKRFGSIQEFAGKIAGMSEYAVDRILQLHAKIKDKPCLLKLFESGAEGWSKIEKVVYVAKIETDKLWAEKIVALSTRALEVLVQSYRSKIPHVGDTQNGTLFGQGVALVDESSNRTPFFEPPVRFSFPASREVEFDLRLAKQRLERQTKQVLSWNETFQWIIKNSKLEGSLSGRGGAAGEGNGSGWTGRAAGEGNGLGWIGGAAGEGNGLGWIGEAAGEGNGLGWIGEAAGEGKWLVPSSETVELCKKCAKKQGVFKICEECSRKIV